MGEGFSDIVTTPSRDVQLPRVLWRALPIIQTTNGLKGCAWRARCDGGMRTVDAHGAHIGTRVAAEDGVDDGAGGFARDEGGRPVGATLERAIIREPGGVVIFVRCRSFWSGGRTASTLLFGSCTGRLVVAVAKFFVANLTASTATGVSAQL